ncbi:EKC/KEOPS complex subunit LAGE3 [Sitodiplosis mosellana]|uniref:EKC/KEOPS complex subunit LAGE3 n=1 Tax=Sitodiplosis mosellana TaxID=263140 RepID=UPI002443DE50|nr:EKC/KEOPS complex subunit LAGE3 [Sitodiplosis mosellana]
MESNGKPTGYNVDLRIPFPSRRQAEIAYDVLRIDAEPKRSAVTKQLQLESNDIIVSFSAVQAKQVRVSVNAFLEAIILCTETMQQFGPPAATYDYE